MEVSRIIAEIDAQIQKLQQARAALAGVEASSAAAPRGRGRPRGSKNAAPAKASTGRRLSPEGRKRIADAMKRRWAERKKAPAKAAAKTPPAAK